MEDKTTQSIEGNNIYLSVLWDTWNIYSHTSPRLEAIIRKDTFQECKHISIAEFEEKEGKELWGKEKVRERNRERERGCGGTKTERKAGGGRREGREKGVFAWFFLLNGHLVTNTVTIHNSKQSRFSSDTNLPNLESLNNQL